MRCGHMGQVLSCLSVLVCLSVSMRSQCDPCSELGHDAPQMHVSAVLDVCLALISFLAALVYYGLARSAGMDPPDKC